MGVKQDENRGIDSTIFERQSFFFDRGKGS